MRLVKEHEFIDECIVYIITETNGIMNTTSFNYQHYLNNQDKYKGKVLIITPPETAIYFRQA